MLPDEKTKQAMAAALDTLSFNRYPDPLATAPCAAFARMYGVSTDCVTAGNGSDELISVIMSTFLQKGEAMMVLMPDFSMYKFYTHITENRAVVYEKNADLQIDVDEALALAKAENVRLIVFSNPCNPTSVGLDREHVRRLITGTDALVVLDEAYMDFWDQSLLDEVERYDNLIILRTASKALGLAAVRLGFAVANRRLTGIIRAAKSPYNVNMVTQTLAAIALDDPDYQRRCAAALIASREALAVGLQPLLDAGKITRMYPSCTNFVLLELPNARRVFEKLKADYSIVVRCFGDTRLRITGGSPAENAAVLAALSEIL
ncbi:MAG: aminotransferase class I/II-fold pyridoxal phosphate-dependent enzyme [Clostridia bacterium]|nr:aminotransferase class I/II-fold pyridoxal phosphate-dependent enzyme [Clostridia bacterium]